MVSLALDPESLERWSQFEGFPQVAHEGPGPLTDMEIMEALTVGPGSPKRTLVSVKPWTGQRGMKSGSG